LSARLKKEALQIFEFEGLLNLNNTLFVHGRNSIPLILNSLEHVRIHLKSSLVLWNLNFRISTACFNAISFSVGGVINFMCVTLKGASSKYLGKFVEQDYPERAYRQIVI